MARKRNRDDDDTEEDVEIESASSSFRQGSGHKRSRVAMAQARGGSTVSDEESDGDVDRTLNDNGQLEDYEFPEHSEDEGDDLDPREELLTTQFVYKQMNQSRENSEMDYGVIEEVRCRNFMCHGNLRIKLGPLINFIIGHNGSGKSAVLTALTMCLGGKATATNRGASLKSLIKEGEESATLAVKIKNQGDGAYKSDLFGESITVERHFSRSGTSGFKIKNQSDKVVTTKKADLDDLLDFFAFQLDNPINVLTQDMARQFLSNSSPADKYKFFIKGTQLETLDADYRVLEENLDNVEAKTRSREEDIEVLKQKSDESEQRKKRLDKTESIRRMRDETTWMHAWAQVEEQEKLLAVNERDLQMRKDSVEQATNEAEDASGAYEGHNQTFEAAERSLTDVKDQKKPLQDEYDNAKEVFDKNTKELMDHKAQERGIKSDLTNARQRKTKLEQDIAEEQARLDEAEGPQHGQRLQRLEELKQDVEEVKGRAREHHATLAPLEQARVDALKAQKEAEPAVHEQATAHERAAGQVQRLQGRPGDKYSGFRQNMARLVKAIDQETRWRKKPVGPAGLHVKLLKPEWSSIIEKTFGNVLESFLVTSVEDQRLLTQIMKRSRDYPQIPIYIGDDEPLDTTGKEPDASVDTILRVLQIDNDLVRNQFIINQSIEQCVLIGDRQRAEQYMNGGQRPHNVKVVLAHTNNKGAGVRFEHTRSGASKASPVQPWTGPSRMQTDRAEQLRRAQETEREARVELENMRKHINELKRAADVAKQATVRWQRESKDIDLQRQRAEEAVEGMESEIEVNKPQDGKLQELQNQLEAAKEEIESIGHTYQDGVVAKDALNEKAKEYKARVDAATAELRACEDRIDRAETKKEKLGNTREAALREKNKAFAHIESAKERVETATKTRDDQKETVDTYISQASRISGRVAVEPGVTLKALDARLSKFESDLQRIEQEAGGTREELTEAWIRAKTAYHTADSQLEQSLRLMRAIKGALAERKIRWRKFRKHIAARARNTFALLLQERQFRGALHMDHEGRELEISVEPDVTKRSNAGRQTQTLSGGEKSFSTICLLLAIWDAMGSPIRCLDEFDVFMDSVNRATSMSMMIQAARRAVGRQFILITPQSMANVQIGGDVSVHRMSDPERGQTTLPY